MVEPWITRTQSRNELDASSSASLARSIYGSQVYFDGGGTSSTYLGSEVNILSSTKSLTVPSTHRLTRPKSSPARTIAERNQMLMRRPSSALPCSSWSGHQFNSSRPGSANPMHRGRPTSALLRAKVKRRPHSAAPGGIPDPLLEVEDYDDPSFRSSSRMRSTNPVTLNSIPEYIKVWEGKPLLSRDYGLKQFERKPWQRPKSDYGLRSTGRRRRKSSKDEIIPVISVTEVSEGSHDVGTLGNGGSHGNDVVNAWEQVDDDWGDKTADNNVYKSLTEDDKGSGDDRRGKGDDELTGHHTGKYGNRADGNDRRNNEDSDLWASRIQLPKEDTDSDDDDDYFKKSEGSGELTWLPSVNNLTNEKPESNSGSSTQLPSQSTIKLPPVTTVNKAPPPLVVLKGDTGRSVLIQLQQQKPEDSRWMDYHMALARHSTRFELPMDMKKLESMSPEHYLCVHCIVSDRRVQHYKRIFTTATRKYNPLQAAAKYLHGYEQIVTAIIDAHHNSLSVEEVYKVMDVVCLSSEQLVDFKLFCGICALTERMYRDKFISTRSTGPAREYGRYKEVVEDADFQALDWKLRGCTISKSLRNLFSQL